MNLGVLVGFQVKLEKYPSALCDTKAVIKRANHRLRNDSCKYIRHVSARLLVEKPLDVIVGLFISFYTCNLLNCFMNRPCFVLMHTHFYAK